MFFPGSNRNAEGNSVWSEKGGITDAFRFFYAGLVYLIMPMVPNLIRAKNKSVDFVRAQKMASPMGFEPMLPG